MTLAYAKRLASAVNAEVDRWMELYPDVQRIFFDEQPSQATDAATIGDCVAYVRGKLGRWGLLVTSPGVTCARKYLGEEVGPVVA